MQPKKSLGQNFLRDASVVERIIQSSGLGSEDVVLEIGPGEGVLTEALSKVAKRVAAVEIDQRLIADLKNKFENNKNVEIFEGDILDINLAEFLKKAGIVHYKLIANLPYYITSPIIRLFLESENPPAEMVLMVQKEVAERIVAGPGEMSILAVSVQYYAKPEILFPVSRHCFFPVPEVESAVIRISKIKNDMPKSERAAFFRLVKAGFCAKRKTLINNLANSFHRDKNTVAKEVVLVGLAENVRAQELSVGDWQKLTKIVLLLDKC